MGVVKNTLTKAKTNIKTNTAIGTLGALAVTAGGYFVETTQGVPIGDFLGVNLQTLMAAEAVAAVGLIAPGILGRGYQSKEQFDAMVKAKKEAKEAKKQAKAANTVASPEKEAEKLAKKLNIPVPKAMEIVREQIAQKEAEAEKARQAKEQKIIQKLAKKLNISEKQAQEVRKEQLKDKEIKQA